MVLQALSEYIENLCRQHRFINHRDDDCHFVDLNNDKKQTYLADKMRYPAVFFSNNGYRMQVIDNNIKRNHNCRIEVWSHVKDTGDYQEIESALEMANECLGDILAKMLYDKRQRTQSFLMGVNLDGAQVYDVENKSNALYGCYVDFTYTETFCRTLTDFNSIYII